MYLSKIQLFISVLIFLFIVPSCKKNETLIEPCNCNIGYVGDNCTEFDFNKIQYLLDSGVTPQTLFEGNVPLDSLYGKMYADGMIFYLDPLTGNGMVAAPSSYIPYAPTLWGCPTQDIAGINNVIDCHGGPSCFQPVPLETEIGARIGDGMANTNAILAECSDTLNAASLCRSLGPDWFLPSRGELNQMYLNLHLNENSDFEDHFFLSSSEGTFSYSIWIQAFSNGLVFGSDKFVPADFRAVKEF